MPSPVRRSARGALPGKPPPPASTTSSSSLASSSRQDRNVSRSTMPANATTTNTTTKQKSDTPRSLSSEDVSEPPRRSQRSQQTHTKLGQHDTGASSTAKTHRDGNEHAVIDYDEEEVEGEVGDEEEEVTRCVCGHQDYPGPPLSEAFTDAETQSEDAGSLFISCDGCSVWQHGGCVGIVEDSQAPEKYFCEECRPKLHDLHADSRGQKYSLYIPLHPKPTTTTTARKSSMSKHGSSSDKAQRERENTASRLSADPATGRRRATMRSKEHDDEEEQIARAIEESKREVEGSGGRLRGGKRGRDESEDVKADIKRQRTGSDSLPAPLSRLSSHDAEDSDLDADSGLPSSRSKKARAEAVQSARQAEVREKEREKEKARAEAAGRRQERAGRRRGDEADAEDPNKIGDTPTSPLLSSQPPSPPAETTSDNKATQKRGAGGNRKTKRLGNNQYTRHRDDSHPAAASSPHLKKRGNETAGSSSNGLSSGDEQAVNGDAGSSSGGGGGVGTNKDSPAAAESTGAGAGASSSVPPTSTAAGPSASASAPPPATTAATATTASAGTGTGTTKGNKFGRGKNKTTMGYNGSRFTATLGPQDLADLSIPDMARQITAMAAFMSRAQVELGGSATVGGGTAASTSSESTAKNGQLEITRSASDTTSTAIAAAAETDGGKGDTAAVAAPSNDGLQHSAPDGRKFEELSALEMADVLGRNMSFWESRFVAAPAGPGS